ncbi:MAG: hypothetical protein PUG96_02575 [Prevotellaceae bacterium]|nr:hypothetical protein [Prevotellaceae bacterium]
MSYKTIKADALNIDTLRAMKAGDEVTLRLPTEKACERVRKYAYNAQKRIGKGFSVSADYANKEVTITCTEITEP